MKILVVGSGGREHAIGWKIKKDDAAVQLFFAPGNGGTAELGTNLPVAADDIAGLVKAAKQNEAGLVVVGPEVPLALGLIDALKKEGIAAFGPDKKAARLESSKSFAKEFMQKYGVPTAGYASFDTAQSALKALEMQSFPMVIKADGLAAGKGVYICEDKKTAQDAVGEIMQQKIFGSSGETIIFEEFLSGREISLLCFVDGETILPMQPAADYKRIGEGDSGANTGGMGSVSPVSYYNEAATQLILENTLKGIKAEGFDYKGLIFIGLMVNEAGSFVLEYNVRFGDPETEVLLPRMQSSLLDILLLTASGKLAGAKISWSKQPAITVVLASGGYPEKYKTGLEISGAKTENSQAEVFHCGTKTDEEGRLLTNGGRVLAVTAMGESVAKAREAAYKKAGEISFSGKYCRGDIGFLRGDI